MKIAIISDNHFRDKKGVFNSIHNRIKYLQKITNFEIEPFIILEYENWIIRILRRTKKISKINYYNYDGITYNVLWVKFSIITYLIRIKLHRFPTFILFKYYIHVKKFRKYDFIIAHSTIPGFVATLIKKKFSIPFSVTWHGSDIHTEPTYNNDLKELVKEIIGEATYNFFVSKKLLEESPKINQGSKIVLNNGVDKTIFYKRIENERQLLKLKYNIIGERNVAYIGNLVPVKNCSVLPLVFNRIIKSFSNVQFHIIGDGKQREYLESECGKLKINVKFFGNRALNEIPELINCMDLILLPSLNEGLPLIALEALACGVPIIGSDTGGIPEVLGTENVVELNDNFIKNFSNKAIEKLTLNDNVILSVEYGWEQIARIETDYLNSITKLS